MRSGSLSKSKWKDRFTYVKDVPFDENDLNCKGSKFQIVKFKPNTRIKCHYHKKTSEVFSIRKGNGILKINDKEFKCKKDDFFLCEPNDIHEFINDKNEDFIILIFKTNEEDNDIFWK